MEVFRQGDARWATKKIGVTDLTMRNYGCTITCVAQALKIAGYDIDPGKLVDQLNHINGFTAGGFLIWGKVTQLYSGFHYDEASGKQYDFVELRNNKRVQHFVLNHLGIVYDPLYGKNAYPPEFFNVGFRKASIYKDGQLT